MNTSIITGKSKNALRHRNVKRREVPSKVDAIYDQLLDMAHKLGPHAKMPTVRVLRGDLNVSQATLDAALLRLENHNVIRRRQGSGVYVSPGLRLRNIVLLCNPDYFLHYGTSPFWGLLVDRINDFAARNEARLMLHFLRPPDRDVLPFDDGGAGIPSTLRDEIETGAVHGVIAVGVEHDIARWIEAYQVPVVAYAGAAAYIIGQGTEPLVQMGVAALVRQGCTRIAPWFLNDSALYPTYRGAMLAHSLTPLPPIVLPDNVGKINLRESFALALEIFGGANTPDSVVCSDDMQAQTILMALHRLHLRPGRDLQIATHSNAESTALLGWHGEITRMEYDAAQIVHHLFETLDALMNGDEPPWLDRTIHVPEYMFQIDPVLILPQSL